MIQLWRAKQTVLAGVEVDVDVVQNDYKGRVPNWVVL